MPVDMVRNVRAWCGPAVRVHGCLRKPDRPGASKQCGAKQTVERAYQLGVPCAGTVTTSPGCVYNVVSAECEYLGSLPCSFGGCEFSKDLSGMLDRTGSCPTKTGTLRLDNKGIKGLREGVFSNMGACE